jgi:hypothetical protein
MQVRDGVPCPQTYGNGKTTNASWGYTAWLLMPYREMKGLIDKFYARQSGKNLEDRFQEALGNREYRIHLQERISTLFVSAAYLPKIE